MLFSAELVDLVLYCVQQVGVMFSVGASTIILIAYLVSMRDGKVDTAEERFGRAVERVLGVGLLFIILSGAAITFFHITRAEGMVVFAPAFVFKWMLIAGLTVAYLLKRGKPFSHFTVEGIIGGSWYALFLLHILAPVISFSDLFLLYGVWIAGFIICWSACVAMTSGKPLPLPKVSLPKPPPLKMAVSTPKQPTPSSPLPQKSPVVPATPTVSQKPAALPPTPPAPVLKPIVVAPITPAAASAPPAPPSPVVAPPPVQKKPEAPHDEHDPHHSPWLPAIHVMPRSHEDLKQNRHITPVGLLLLPKPHTP